MRSYLCIAALGLVPFLAACAAPAASGDGEPAGRQMAVETGPFEVPAGDTFECFYTGVRAAEDLSVTRIGGRQGPGGHHITVYVTDSDAAGHAPCNDEEMATWRMVGVADIPTSGEPALQLPEGLAYRLEEGKQIALQVHYINVTGAPYEVEDEVTLELAEPEDVEAYANLFTMVDIGLSLAPNAATKRVSSFVMKEDLPLFWVGGHMHELGTHYTLEITPPGGAPGTVYEHDWADVYTSHPPLLTYDKDSPLVLAKGTVLRQTCEWQNDTPEDVTFPREMCAMFGFYFPDDGAGEKIVLAHPDVAP